VTDHAHAKKRTPYDYGGNPLAHIATNNSDLRMPAFGGEFQPGLYRMPKSNFGNPAPLGLSAFALTTFILSLINLRARGVNEANLVVASAYAYGGLVQLLAGMWEMAVGNTFGATALSSYGGFWISFAITLTPGGFGIVTALGGAESGLFLDSFGFFLMVSYIVL
jgi:succinate-acetate transporter protein